MRSIRRSLLWTLGPGLIAAYVCAGLLLHAWVQTRTLDALDADLRDQAKARLAGLGLAVRDAARAELQQLGARADEDDAARARLLEMAPDAFHIPEVETRAWADALAAGWHARLLVVNAQGETRAFEAGERVAGESSRAASEAREDIRFPDPQFDAQWQALRGNTPGLRWRATLEMTRSTEEAEAFLGTLRLALLGTGIVLALLTALWVAWRVGRGLRPLEATAQAIDALDPEALDQSITRGNEPAELVPVTRGLDSALERIAASVRREKRTSADLAHELRTPVAELKALTEVGVRWNDDTELQAQTVREAHEVAEHMQDIVSGMLLLARARSGQMKPARDPVDVTTMVQAQHASLVATIETRDLDVRMRSEALEVESDARLLDLALRNLVENAVHHAPPASSVAIEISAAPSPRVVVRNEAPALKAEDLAAMTEPYWRADAARTGASRAGLGLALTQEMADVLGARLTLSLENGELSAAWAFPHAPNPAP